MSEPRRAGDRLRSADHRPDLPHRRATGAYEQILQQQSDAHADRESAVAVQEIDEPGRREYRDASFCVNVDFRLLIAIPCEITDRKYLTLVRAREKREKSLSLLHRVARVASSRVIALNVDAIAKTEFRTGVSHQYLNYRGGGG